MSISGRNKSPRSTAPAARREALRVCDAHRKALRDELGLAPSTAMGELERRVLNQDPTLLAADAGFMTPLPAWTSEFLPFVGRDVEFDQVLSCLAEAVDGGLRFVSVEGDAGIGKSRFLAADRPSFRRRCHRAAGPRA